MHIFKKCLGFDFVKAGDFYLADEPRTGSDKNGPWEVYASLELFDKRYRKADETVYFVTADYEIMYVGEYTYNFEDRWLSGNYVNHHKYLEIEMELKEKREVSIWLAISPYCEAGDIEEFNLSKSLEQEILRKIDPPWNSRNKTAKWKKWRADNCIKINTLVGKP
jgi:hypothetical protein